MSNLYSGLSGVRFPEVVMNQGPLPGTGGLPAPLHDTPDSRINYGSTLLGDISPYAYGEPGYLSSQNAYLNIPHRIQKFIPALWLPEPDGSETFQISHGVDDGDISFVMRLNRKSIFCSGTKTAALRGGIGNVVDPFINLPTLNYLLAGIQLNVAGDTDNLKAKNLWFDLLYDLNPDRFPKDRRWQSGHVPNGDGPAHGALTLDDLIHIVQHCIRPFGIARGSEKQGGQSETTLSSVQWPAPAMLSMVLDGKDGNVVNIWHKHDFHAGDDLVLRFKPMPLPAYVLNHYYKAVVRKRFALPQITHETCVWQLVPDVYGLDYGEKYLEHMMLTVPRLYDPTHHHMKTFKVPVSQSHSYFLRKTNAEKKMHVAYSNWIHVINGSLGGSLDIVPWQELGFWHIGRTQVMMQAYGHEEFFANDLANNLKTNHLEITFQPVFVRHPHVFTYYDSSKLITYPSMIMGSNAQPQEITWEAELGLEFSHEDERPAQRQRTDFHVSFADDVGECLYTTETTDALGSYDYPMYEYEAAEASTSVTAVDERPSGIQSVPPPEESIETSQVFAAPSVPGGGKRGKRSRPVEGSLLRADGTTETSNVTLLS